MEKGVVMRKQIGYASSTSISAVGVCGVGMYSIAFHKLYDVASNSTNKRSSPASNVVIHGGRFFALSVEFFIVL